MKVLQFFLSLVFLLHVHCLTAMAPHGYTLNLHVKMSSEIEKVMEENSNRLKHELFSLFKKNHVDTCLLKNPGVSWSSLPPKYEFHITLIYFDGERSQKEIADIEAVIQSVTNSWTEKIDGKIATAPEFIGKNGWICYSIESDSLKKLRDVLHKALQDAKITMGALSEEPFNAHISIGRIGKKDSLSNENKLYNELVALDKFMKGISNDVPNGNYLGDITVNGSTVSAKVQQEIGGKKQTIKKNLIRNAENSVLESIKNILKTYPLNIDVSFQAIELLKKNVDTGEYTQSAYKFHVDRADALKPKLKNLVTKLNGLKAKLKDLAQQLTTLKGALAGAGAVGAGSAPVHNPLPLVLQKYPYAHVIHDDTMTVKISPKALIGDQKAPSGSKIYITVVVGDIAPQKFLDGSKSAIVNAANSGMRGGGGMDTAIHNAAQDLLEYEKYYNLSCPTGHARITPSFKIAGNEPGKTAHWIIHCVGPVGEKSDLLKNTYQNALGVAWKNGLEAICFCAISTAIFNYDIKKATPVALRAVIDFLKINKPLIREVRFFIFKGDNTSGTFHYTSQEAYNMYQKELDTLVGTDFALKKSTLSSGDLYARLNESSQKTITENKALAPLIYELTIH